jgi:hypothetical protein
MISAVVVKFYLGDAPSDPSLPSLPLPFLPSLLSVPLPFEWQPLIARVISYFSLSNKRTLVNANSKYELTYFWVHILLNGLPLAYFKIYDYAMHVLHHW